jgi:hypothetical protein
MHLGRPDLRRWSRDNVRRLQFRGAGFYGAGFGRSSFCDGLGANRGLFANRFIDVTAGLGLTRRGFQGALARREFALR